MASRNISGKMATTIVQEVVTDKHAHLLANMKRRIEALEGREVPQAQITYTTNAAPECKCLCAAPVDVSPLEERLDKLEADQEKLDEYMFSEGVPVADLDSVYERIAALEQRQPHTEFTTLVRETQQKINWVRIVGPAYALAVISILVAYFT